MFQPQRFDVLPVEVGRDDHANAPVPAQVTRGRVAGKGRVEDPTCDQVVQGPMGGDVLDAKIVQPDGAAVGQPADQTMIVPEPAGAQVQPEAGPVRRSTRATKGITSRYKDFVLGEEAQD